MLNYVRMLVEVDLNGSFPKNVDVINIKGAVIKQSMKYE